jgi:protocatechuate 3,4-dioxygenase beta subunit
VRSFFAGILLLVVQAALGHLPLHGRVVRAGTNEPVARASIVLAKIGGTLDDYRETTADEAGEFSFTDLTPGNYRLYGTRTGYLRAEYGRRTTSNQGRTIAVGDRQAQPEITLDMIPAGVITGRITDNEGKPIRNAWVRAQQADYRSGQRQLETVEFGQTNDLGEYRISDLPPGPYFISASLDSPRVEGDLYVAILSAPKIETSSRAYKLTTRTSGTAALAAGQVSPVAFDSRVFFPVFYPNTKNAADATPVDLGMGVTISGIDLRLSSTPTFHVRGRVINGDSGEPYPNTLITIAPLEGVRSGSAGMFDIPGVPPDKYELWTSALPTSLTGVTKIEVEDQDLENVTIVMRPTVTLTGKLTIDGRRPGPADPTFFAGFVTPPGRTGMGGASFQADGTFSIPNVGPGDYILRASGKNAYVRSARFGNADALNSPVHIEADLRGQTLEITMSLNTGVLDVRVVNGKRQSVANIPVTVVPDASRRSRPDVYKIGLTDASGRAHIEGIEPGDYRIFASEDIDPQTWRDQSAVRIYESKGEPVHVAERGKHEVTATLITQRP